MEGIKDGLLFQHDIDKVLIMPGKHHVAIVRSNGLVERLRKLIDGAFHQPDVLFSLYMFT